MKDFKNRDVAQALMKAFSQIAMTSGFLTVVATYQQSVTSIRPLDQQHVPGCPAFEAPRAVSCWLCRPRVVVLVSGALVPCRSVSRDKKLPQDQVDLGPELGRLFFYTGPQKEQLQEHLT